MVGVVMFCYFDIVMMFFIGLMWVGVQVLQDVVVGIKKVMLEFGGKFLNFVFVDCDLEICVVVSVLDCFYNLGQLCNVLICMLIEWSVYDQVFQIVKVIVEV